MNEKQKKDLTEVFHEAQLPGVDRVELGRRVRKMFSEGVVKEANAALFVSMCRQSFHVDDCIKRIDTIILENAREYAGGDT